MRQATLRGAGICLAGAILGVGFFGREGRFGLRAANDLCRAENPDGRPRNLARGCRSGRESASGTRLADLPCAGGVQRGLLFRVSNPGYSAFALRDGGGVGVLAADAGWATGLDDLGRVAIFGQDRRPDTWFLGHSGCERGQPLWEHIRGGRGVRGGLGVLLGPGHGLFQAIRSEDLDHVGGGVAVRMGGMVLTLFSFAMESWSEVSPTGTLFASLSYVSLVEIALAWLIWFGLIRAGEASRVAVYVFFVPLVGIVIGAIFLDERPTLSLWIGTALIVTGIYTVNRSSTRKYKRGNLRPD